MGIYENLSAQQIELPSARVPSAVYVPFAISGNLVFLSGHTAKKDGKAWVGKLGETMSVEEGKQAARSVAIDLLGTLQEAVGDLKRVTRILKLTSLVNSSVEFKEHHLVTNGASELLSSLFGEAGRHARSAFGVAQIPHGSCIEIEMIVEISS